MSNNFCLKKNNRCSGRTIHWTIAFALSVAFALSLASVLDCKFVQVNIGFVPINFNKNFSQDTASISIGLWSTPNPNQDESQCLSPIDSRDVVGLTKSDSFYQQILYNGDDLWSLARILALLSLIIAFVDMVMWTLICTCIRWSNGRHCVFCGTIFALVCEGVKYGIFLNITPCSSAQYWEKNVATSAEVMNQRADDCTMSRGAYFSLVSIVLYFIATISLAWSISPELRTITQDLEYDDISMPSFLQSIGESLTSKFSKGSSMISSKSGNGGRRFSGPGPSNHMRREMAPIKEYDDDDQV